MEKSGDEHRGEAVKQYTIEHLMVPLSEYATVRVGSTLYEAILALEQAQEEFDQGRYKHRGMLVLNGDGRVIGKLNHLDALQALEPETDDDIATTLAYYGFSKEFVRDIGRRRRMEGAPLVNLCRKAVMLKVEDLMQRMSIDECIDYRAGLDLAIHQLTWEKLLSLLVVRDGDIIGILRLSDVFAAVYHAMTESFIGEDEYEGP